MTDPVSSDGLADEPDSLGLCDYTPAEIDISVSAGDWAASDLADVLGAVKAVLAATGANKEGLSVAVNLADNETLHTLNKAYRQKDKPTNVLSFPALNSDDVASEVASFEFSGFPMHLGDLAIASGVLEREAEDQQKVRTDHLKHLVVHGVLHLLGHDHMNDDDAEEMESLEKQILADLGTYDPYKERAHETAQQDT